MSYDYESKFASASSGQRRIAACHLIGEADDPKLWYLLPVLYKSMKSIKPADARSDDQFADMTRVGLRASAKIMKNVGFDRSDQLHSSIWDWFVNATESENAQLAAGAIYSLEPLGIPPNCVRERLLELMAMPARSHPGKTGTCRAVAFRVLLQLDAPTAALYFDSPACNEFREMVTALHKESSSGLANVARKNRLETELQWLESAE